MSALRRWPRRRGELWLCVAGLLPGCLLLYAYYGTVYATIQDIVEPAMRGMAMAIYFCAMYLLGGVLGPVATGWASDYFARRAAAADGAATVTEWHKAVGLHDAMYLIPILNAALVVVLFAASRTVKRDYRSELSAIERTEAQVARDQVGQCTCTLSRLSVPLVAAVESLCHLFSYRIRISARGTPASASKPPARIRSASLPTSRK